MLRRVVHAGWFQRAGREVGGRRWRGRGVGGASGRRAGEEGGEQEVTGYSASLEASKIEGMYHYSVPSRE